MSSSAKRALRILKLVGQAERPLGLSDIARFIKSPPATAFRALDALNRAGLVSRYQSSSRYVLGHTAERLRQSVIAQFRMRDVCLPYLRQLASASGETASLFVRLGWYAVRIASVPGAGEIAHMPSLGEAAMLGGSYAGTAILAFLPSAEAAAYRAWAAKQKRKAPAQAELSAIVERGYAMSNAEFAGGVAVAIPIRHASIAAASLAVEGPALSRETSNLVSDWIEIAHAIESLARTQPALFANPFAHIAADSIVLGRESKSA